MRKSDKVVREGLLEEGTLVHGPAEGRPEREALQVEARAGQRSWGRGALVRCGVRRRAQPAPQAERRSLNFF